VVLTLAANKIPNTVKILIIGAFINSFGNSLLWPLNSIFMHEVLGRPLTQAGIVMALQSGLSLLGQFFGGWLADKIGPKKVMVVGLLTASCCVGLIGMFPVWQVYAPGIVFMGLAYSLIFVPLNALIVIIWPEGGRQGFNYLYVGSNAGVAVGTALGGLVAQISFRLVFFSNAITFLIYFLILIFGLGQVQKRPNQGSVQSGFANNGFSLEIKTLLTVSVGILLVWSAYSQWGTVLPIVMKQKGFSLPQYSFLWTLNGVFIVTLQPITNWVIRNWASSFQGQFYLACLLITIAFVILFGQLPYWSYIVAMLILTLGEMLILPAVPAVVAHLAPEGRQGTFQGIVGGFGSGGRAVGPLMGGMIFDLWGGQGVWVMALGFMTAAIVVFMIYGMLERQMGVIGE
jgi:MFS family permease